ncbi:anti-sigma factor [Microbacterium oxydans]|uniref:Regulator of SigK n=1 Tax=Microbacterium oxydans TaxID=82380 RepID=A0A0F0L6B5_9MICO|nr:anti-sigma factor [Microbacterium oxydans]KJL28678.1 Anti-sigma-K factor RskA [Microbacterium oxydans]
MNEAEFAELAAGAALNALSPVEERRFRDALAAHPEWADLVDDDVETAGVLAMNAMSVAPPAHIRSALLAQIAVTPQHPVDDRSAAPLDDSVVPDVAPALVRAPRRWSRSLLALAACLALVVGVGIGAATLNTYLNRPASVVALEQIQSADDAQEASVTLDDGGTATAHWSASVGTAVLVTDGIPSAADGETYELWFVRGDAPVSAGVFDTEGGDATAVLAGDMHEGDVIAVTVEQAGGSPSGAPTSDPFIVIPTA